MDLGDGKSLATHRVATQKSTSEEGSCKGQETTGHQGVGLSELLGEYQGDELREKLFKDGSDCRHHHHSCVSTHRWWLTVCQAPRVSPVSHPQPHSTPVEKLTRLRVGTLRFQNI